MSTEYESERPRAKPTGTLQEIRADGIRECIRMLRAVHVTTCTATAEKELDSLLSRLSTLEDDLDAQTEQFLASNRSRQRAEAQVVALDQERKELGETLVALDALIMGDNVVRGSGPVRDRVEQLLAQEEANDRVVRRLGENFREAKAQVVALQAELAERMTKQSARALIADANRWEKAYSRVCDEKAALQAELEAKQEALRRIALIKPDLRPIKESDNFHRAEKAVSIARAALADAGGSATPPHQEAAYNPETNQWAPQCPYGDVCAGCDAAGVCSRWEQS